MCASTFYGRATTPVSALLTRGCDPDDVFLHVMLGLCNNKSPTSKATATEQDQPDSHLRQIVVRVRVVPHQDDYLRRQTQSAQARLQTCIIT